MRQLALLIAALGLAVGCSRADSAAPDSALTLFDGLSAIHRDRPDTGLLRRLHSPADTILCVEGSKIELLTGDSLFRRVLAAHGPVRAMTQRFTDRNIYPLDDRSAILTATEDVDWVVTAGSHQYHGVLTITASRQGRSWVIRGYRGT